MGPAATAAAEAFGLNDLEDLENEDDDMSFDQQCENLQVWSVHYV